MYRLARHCISANTLLPLTPTLPALGGRATLTADTLLTYVKAYRLLNFYTLLVH